MWPTQASAEGDGEHQNASSRKENLDKPRTTAEIVNLRQALKRRLGNTECDDEPYGLQQGSVRASLWYSFVILLTLAKSHRNRPAAAWSRIHGLRRWSEANSEAHLRAYIIA